MLKKSDMVMLVVGQIALVGLALWTGVEVGRTQEQKIKVVYSQVSGVRAQLGEGVAAQRVACWDGAMKPECLSIYCYMEPLEPPEPLHERETEEPK